MSSSKNEAEAGRAMAAGGNSRWASYSRSLFCDQPFRLEPGMPHWTLMWKLALPNSCTEAAALSSGG